MKSLTKLALVGTALAASAGAYADVAVPSGGVGQAVLFVKNETTGAVYARGLSLTADQVATQASIQSDTYTGSGTTPDTSLTFSLASSIGPDANLTGFLNSSDSFSYAVMLADSSGGLTVGDKRLYTTTAQPTVNVPQNSSINTMTAQFNTFIGSLNAALPDSGDNSIPVGGLWDQSDASVLAQNADTWFGQGLNNKVTLGETASFYLLTTNGGTTGTFGRSYLLGQLRLTASGTLESVGSVPEVPLPPAVWLLGSALAGFAGLRRRMDGTAAA